jgi:hypothetical protein
VKKPFPQIQRLTTEIPALRPIRYTLGELSFLFTDASKVGAGAWEGSRPTTETAIPTSFHSKRFAAMPLHYPVHELKLSAIVDAVEMFQPILYGTTFTIVSDNKSLNYFMKQTTMGQRLTRWKMFLQSYNFTMIHTTERKDLFTDTLS